MVEDPLLSDLPDFTDERPHLGIDLVVDEEFVRSRLFTVLPQSGEVRDIMLERPLRIRQGVAGVEALGKLISEEETKEGGERVKKEGEEGEEVECRPHRSRVLVSVG